MQLALWKIFYFLQWSSQIIVLIFYGTKISECGIKQFSRRWPINSSIHHNSEQPKNFL